MMAISEHPDLTALIEGAAASPQLQPVSAGQQMTLAEFLALPEQKPALEYAAGDVTQKMAAKPVHGALQTFLVESVNQFARPQRLGVALTETRFLATNWAPVPDVVYYRRERLHVRRAPAEFTEPPDLAIEILSPGQHMPDQMQKCLDYIEYGVAVALLVLPADEAVFVFSAGQQVRVLQGDARIGLDDVLPGYDLTARQLFDAVNWSWLDEEPAGQTAQPDEADSGTAQAPTVHADDAAASGRSEG